MKSAVKLSVITVVRNAENTIGNCITSVINQTYSNVEYIVIDGASTDNTINIINQYKEHITAFVSAPDKGIYDAMNKGIAMATGDYVGILNADDTFAYDGVLADIAAFFAENKMQILYGNLDFIDKNGKITRKWRSQEYKYGLFNAGWMPAHPTFYCRRELFNMHGNYNLNYGTAADYELMLRYLHANKLNAGYLNKTMVKMNVGGASNSSYIARIRALLFDYRSMRNNGIRFPVITVVMKPLRKLLQFI